MTTATRRHPSKRPVQFTRRPTERPTDATDCRWKARRRLPCGYCDRCEHDQALADHPPVISLREVAAL